MHRNHSSEARSHCLCLDLLKDARNALQKTKRQQNFQDKYFCTGKLFHAVSTVITTATIASSRTSEHSSNFTIISSWLAPLPRSDNPSQSTRTNFLPHHSRDKTSTGARIQT